MRRQLTLWTLAAALLLMAGLLAVQAEPLAQDHVVQITSPERNAEVRGLVPIMGSASVPAFQFYKVEYGIGPNPSQWAIVGTMHDAPAINRQLEVWDTTLIPDGVYSLKLQAVKQDGNYDEFLVPQIVVVNSRPTATPTLPEPTDTPIPQVTNTPISYTPEPQPTATTQQIVVEGELSQPTVTPTFSRPSQREALPIDPKSWGQAALYGAGAMAAVLILVGIVFGLRKLL